MGEKKKKKDWYNFTSGREKKKKIKYFQIFRLIHFNGMSTSLGLYYVKKLGITFIITFFE